MNTSAHEREYSGTLRLAKQGDAKAQYSLGLMYFWGNCGAPKDIVKTMKWWGRAAEQWHSEAQEQLGKLYDFGEETPKDYVMAYFWYNLASARECPFHAIVGRNSVEGKMTPSQIEEAQRLTREWLAKHPKK